MHPAVTSRHLTRSQDGLAHRHAPCPCETLELLDINAAKYLDVD